VVDGRDATKVIFSRGLPSNGAIDQKRADAMADLFAIRPDLVEAQGESVARTVVVGGFAGRGSASPRSTRSPAAGVVMSDTRASVYVEQRSAATTTNTITLRTNRPGWRLLLQHASGSLDTVIAQARRRNLLLSFGVLALLAISAGMLVVNTQRAQR